MKKSVFVAFAFLVCLFYTASPIFARTLFEIKQPTQTVQADDVEVQNVVQFILNLLAIVGVIAALVYLLYGGIKWITSGGDKQAVENARHHIIAAIVGLLIVVLSFVILNMVFKILGLTNVNITDINLPGITEL